MQKSPPLRPLHSAHEIPRLVGESASRAEKSATDHHSITDRSKETGQTPAHAHDQRPQEHAAHRETDRKEGRSKKTGFAAWIKTEIKAAVRFSVKITVRITVTVSITIGATGLAANNRNVAAVWNKVKRSDYIPPFAASMVDGIYGWTHPIFAALKIAFSPTSQSPHQQSSHDSAAKSPARPMLPTASPVPAYPLYCQGPLTTGSPSGGETTTLFTWAPTGAGAANPAPGQCAWADRAARGIEIQPGGGNVICDFSSAMQSVPAGTFVEVGVARDPLVNNCMHLARYIGTVSPPFSAVPALPPFVR